MRCAGEIHRCGIENILTKVDLFVRVLETSNLLSQHHKTSLEDCQRASHIMFQDAVTNPYDVTVPPFNATILDPANISAHKDSFYEIVHNNAAVKIIENSLTVNGFDDFHEHKSFFLVREYKWRR